MHATLDKPQPLHFMPRTAQPAAPAGTGRWKVEQIEALLNLPFAELMWQAQQVHRQHFNANEVDFSSLLSVKTGGCPENCGYCSQSAHHDTGLKASKLMEADQVRQAARAAKASGAQRFCMGAAWRGIKERDMPAIAELIHIVKQEGLQACATMGMLEPGQAEQLKAAGLDYYNHNLDCSPGFYGNVVSTRSYEDRLQTLRRVREAGINVCSGGIIGMGETRRQRAELIEQLANLWPQYPDSVPINNLVKVPGTPLENAPDVDPFEFVRMIAVARITMPRARIRLAAGRRQLDDGMQTLCFLAGANSIFLGEKLLTTPNPDADDDHRLLKRLGIRATDAGRP